MYAKKSWTGQKIEIATDYDCSQCNTSIIYMKRCIIGTWLREKDNNNNEEFRKHAQNWLTPKLWLFAFYSNKFYQIKFAFRTKTPNCWFRYKYSGAPCTQQSSHAIQLFVFFFSLNCLFVYVANYVMYFYSFASSILSKFINGRIRFD